MGDVFQALLNDAMRFLLKAVALIVIGVILANIVMESGVIEKLTPFFLPFCRASKLPVECASSLLTCFINPTAGKAMLAGFYQSGKVKGREALLTSIMATFPIVAGESLFRVHAPLAIVMLGPFIGTVYIFLNLLSAFTQSFIAFLIARFSCSNDSHDSQSSQISQSSHTTSHTPSHTPSHAPLHTSHTSYSTPPTLQTLSSQVHRNKKEILAKSLKKSAKTLRKVVPTLIIAFLIIDFLLISGGMKVIGVAFEPLLRIFGLPGECISAIMADLIHFSAGYATVSALLQNGVIDAKQAILTLLIGSMFTITMIYAKHSFSMYVSLFGRLGVKISAANYALSILSKLLVIAIVIVFM